MIATNNSIDIKKRQLNIELLRIICSIFICIHHFTINKYNISPANFNNEISNLKLTSLAFFINSFVIISVNVYFLISGYFGIKLNIKKIISLILNVIFYFVIFYFLDILLNYRTISANEYIYNFKNCLRTTWYIYVYIIIVLLSPILNKIVENLNKQIAKYIIIITFIFFSTIMFINPLNSIGINGGYSLISGIYLYLIGAIIKKYDFFAKGKKNNLIIYLCCNIINWLLSIFFIVIIKNKLIAVNIFLYNNPLIILSSISFLKLFLNINIKESKYSRNIILCFSKHVVTIYILQQFSNFTSNFYSLLLPNFVTNNIIILEIIYVIICSLIWFITSFIIDCLISLIIKNTINIVSEKLSIKIKNIFYKISKVIK
ncbi:MAG: acyltransferase [bacterium]|nr:acyltransferase [bacterium]